MALKYIELKSGHAGNGPAWIADVDESKSRTTVYFNDRALKRSERSLYRDVESGEPYWISGVKKGGTNRHWAGSGKIKVEVRALESYLALTGADTLDMKRYEVTSEIKPTDKARFMALENEPSEFREAGPNNRFKGTRPLRGRSP